MEEMLRVRPHLAMQLRPTEDTGGGVRGKLGDPACLRVAPTVRGKQAWLASQVYMGVMSYGGGGGQVLGYCNM